MMTPDEIKKALHCCCGDGTLCFGNCPYDGITKGIVECTQKLSRDTLDLIQRLEAERDAAVKSLRGNCFECKHNKTSVCLVCSKDKTLKYWEWRGVNMDGTRVYDTKGG